MADIPPANELEDWLHELPAGYFEAIHRYDGEEPTEPTTFELLKEGIVVVLVVSPSDAPPLEVVASAPIQDGWGVLEDAGFQSEIAQATASVPGWTEFVSRNDPAAIDEKPSVVLHSPIYADGLTKHRLLTTTLTLCDAALRTQMVAINATADDD